MTEDPKVEKTNKNSAETNKSGFTTSPITLGWAAIIFGLLIPPVGLVLAAIGLYRAGRTANRIAFCLCIAALIAVAVGGLTYHKAYQKHYDDNKLSKIYSYNDFKIYTVKGPEGKGTGLSFMAPSSFQAQAVASNAVTQASVVQQVKLPGYSNPVTMASVDASVTIPSKAINADLLKTFNSLMTTSGQQTALYTSFAGGLKNYLQALITPLPTIYLGTPTAFTNANIKANAWKFNYEAISSFNDGSKRYVQGTLVFAAGKKNLYYFSVMGRQGSNWSSNQPTWGSILSSLKINQ